MTILFPLFIPALAYFAVLVILAVKKSPKGIGISILFFVLPRSIVPCSGRSGRDSSGSTRRLMI